MAFSLYSTDRAKVLSLYEKTDSDMKEYVQMLREWMKKQLHLPSDLLDDGFLELCLLKNKFSVEKTKSKIEYYCSIKSMDKYKYLYEESPYLRIPSEEIHFHFPIPTLTDDCKRITIGKILDEEKYEMKRDFTNVIMLREIISRYDYNDGEIIIVDYSECSAVMLTKIRANLVADVAAIALKAHSSRIKEIHVIGKFVPTMLSVAKPLLPQAIFKKMHPHYDAGSLTKLLPAKCLPKDYGGELKSLHELKVDILDKIFIEHREELKKYFTTKSREELRQNGPICNDMQGTFKKLNID